jgi:hypothetical protein
MAAGQLWEGPDGVVLVVKACIGNKLFEGVIVHTLTGLLAVGHADEFAREGYHPFHGTVTLQQEI